MNTNLHFHKCICIYIITFESSLQTHNNFFVVEMSEFGDINSNTQGLLRMMFGELYVMPGIKPVSVACKANALLSVLLICPLY